jgi:hypothetical protein
MRSMCSMRGGFISTDYAAQRASEAVVAWHACLRHNTVIPSMNRTHRMHRTPFARAPVYAKRISAHTTHDRDCDCHSYELLV